jgi:PIN domain nuclease of toxin-antitoxin system
VKLLLDTHTLFWWLIEEVRLSPAAFAAIKSKDAEVHVSVASAWEMAIKVGLGKWPEAQALVNSFEEEVEAEGFRILPITIAHARESGLMQAAHRDPFDRLLAAQALHEGLTLVTSDAKMAGLGATIVS